jgi:toxin ParE1/3/4
MGAFTLTNKARGDVKSIAIFTQRKWGKEQRRIYAKQFDDIFQKLSDNPKAGKECDFIKLGYLKFPAMSHIIFYRITSESSIEIVRVLHKRMDVVRQLTPQKKET